MTFAIKDKLETGCINQIGNAFDPEPYNYIFNNSTCFLDDEFVENDHSQLQNVLSNFLRIDIDMLDLL